MKQTETETRERVRKAYAPDGVKAQKMVTFRLDLENLAWLNQQRNKGRYINQLIEADRQRAGSQRGAETGGIGGG